MRKMSPRGQKWLKGCHLTCACLWVGAAFCLSLKQFFIHPADDLELYGIVATLKFIDDFVIIPGALGSLLTGLIYALWTNRGFFKHRWITVKWVINLGGVLFGAFMLGPWLNSLPPLARQLGLAALADPTFSANRDKLLFWGTLQAATLVAAVFISAIKPWRKKKA